VCRTSTAASENCIYKVRYGAENAWSYRDFVGSIRCDNDEFSDPIRKDKKCFRSKTCHSLLTFDECSIEGHRCGLGDAPSPFKVVRYGSEGKHHFRYTNNGALPCTDDIFHDTETKNKRCYYATFPQFFNIEGQWRLVNSGSDVTHQVATGVDSTVREATTRSWTKALKASISINIKIGTITFGGSVSTTVAHTMEQSMTNRMTTTCTTQCKSTPTNPIIYLYQWEVVAQELCEFGGPRCEVRVAACHYLCKTKAYPVPQCPPTYCVDAECDTCSMQAPRLALSSSPMSWI